jgi:hypothetical protein
LRTLNEFAEKYFEPIFNAKKRVWVCSPWISRFYVERLYDLSRKNVEVRIVTSDDEYNAATYSYLSHLMSKDSKSRSTNFDVHFIKKEVVHSKIYVVDDVYAIAGAVNFTFTGLTKQTNNFTVYEGQEVEPIIRDFTRLWIGFKSENVRPTQSTIKNLLPLIPYEKANLVEIKNAIILRKTSAKLTIDPYYKIVYSLLENVRLPWYQQTVIEDKGTVIVDASSGKLLNNFESSDHTTRMKIRDLRDIQPLKETVLESSENYVLENHQWDVKVDDYKAEALARNFIKERNRRNIPYNDRNNGQMYQPYVPFDRAITIISKELLMLPTWSFSYEFKGKNYEKQLLASSGYRLKTSFHIDGAVCEDCGSSVSKDKAVYCGSCREWLCSSEIIPCSSCQKTFHKEHINKVCSICNQVLCNNCETACPICNRQQGKNHLIECDDCGVSHCSKCTIISGLILKKSRCLNCDKIYQEERKHSKEKSLWKKIVD